MIKEYSLNEIAASAGRSLLEGGSCSSSEVVNLQHVWVFFSYFSVSVFNTLRPSSFRYSTRGGAGYHVYLGGIFGATQGFDTATF